MELGREVTSRTAGETGPAGTVKAVGAVGADAPEVVQNTEVVDEVADGATEVGGLKGTEAMSATDLNAKALMNVAENLGESLELRTMFAKR